MYELVQVSEKCYYINCPAKIGIYVADAERVYLIDSGNDKDMTLLRERRKLDRECSVEQEIALLKNCGFKVAACVYSCQKFSVVVAVKK